MNDRFVNVTVSVYIEIRRAQWDFKTCTIFVTIVHNKRINASFTRRRWARLSLTYKCKRVTQFSYLCKHKYLFLR